MKKARENQLTYLFLAIITIPMSIYINYSDIVNGQFSERIMLFFIGTSALMMSYLSPHLFPKDERTKEIIGRSMTANYFTLFAAITLLFLIVDNTLSATQVLSILFCIMVTSIPLTMVIYSKRI
ncbi:hypothetical protein [Lysinibacillus odysseyi]|uniref:Permease n=1 Tax=Lysinibacillus odysseyi 34hs-1 = NBRC 100172 TaxID=1220589 RepID=A0A0A3JD30_9BACI|nr:hypothetical protein [Lysinibacillus odysseyi]KGR84937.1 hypothetical protein CD32_10785 [Lysinibacillus odysseyi 34hs-1 = NBRC 100172]